MRYFLALCVFLTACTQTAPTQLRRPFQDPVSPWKISGSFDMSTGDVVIFLDGHSAAKGSFGPLSTRTEFRGRYEKREIAGDCWITQVRHTSAYTIDCLVFIDNERAAHMSF